MTLGEGIFWSTTLLLLAFFVYQISIRERWRVLGKGLAILFGLGVIAGTGVWIWHEYNTRPAVINELSGISFDMTPTEVQLTKGEPSEKSDISIEVSGEIVEVSSGWIYQITYSSAQLQVNFKGTVRATQLQLLEYAFMEAHEEGKTDEAERLASELQEFEQAKAEISLEQRQNDAITSAHDRRNSLRVSLICEIEGNSKLFGLSHYSPENDVINKLGTPSNISIHINGLSKIISYEKWNVAFEIEKGRVSGLCISKSGKVRYSDELGEPNIEARKNAPTGEELKKLANEYRTSFR